MKEKFLPVLLASLLHPRVHIFHEQVGRNGPVAQTARGPPVGCLLQRLLRLEDYPESPERGYRGATRRGRGVRPRQECGVGQSQERCVRQEEETREETALQVSKYIIHVIQS